MPCMPYIHTILKLCSRLCFWYQESEDSCIQLRLLRFMESLLKHMLKSLFLYLNINFFFTMVTGSYLLYLSSCALAFVIEIISRTFTMDIAEFICLKISSSFVSLRLVTKTLF